MYYDYDWNESTNNSIFKDHSTLTWSKQFKILELTELFTIPNFSQCINKGIPWSNRCDEPKALRILKMMLDYYLFPKLLKETLEADHVKIEKQQGYVLKTN